MGKKYLGGSGESLTVWISVFVEHLSCYWRCTDKRCTRAASTVLVFYGYDQGMMK